MSTATAGRTGRDETKVCPDVGAAVEVVEVGSSIKEQATKDAERLLRMTANLGGPVEPVGIANRLGVQVSEAELRREILGGLFMAPGDDPEIVVNQRDGLIRRRLTCAYELGHYVRRSAETNEYERVDLRQQAQRSHKDPDEIYASQFAACLLMPEQIVKTLAEVGMDELEMALWFVVSREALQLRLESLGLRTRYPQAA